jgi:hypothetical protein
VVDSKGTVRAFCSVGFSLRLFHLTRSVPHRLNRLLKESDSLIKELGRFQHAYRV